MDFFLFRLRFCNEYIRIQTLDILWVRWLPVGWGSNFPKFHQRSHHDVITSLEHWTTYFQCLWPVCCSWVPHRLYFLPKGEKNVKLQPLQCRAVVRFSNPGGANGIRLFIFLSVYFSKHPNYSLPPPPSNNGSAMNVHFYDDVFNAR